MEHRYSLRFESGDRAGETVAIQGQGFTVGRKPGHSLQLVDGSVSGKHAEILIDDTGVLLRDLGSTNGTRVGSERVLEARLEHGDRVVFGSVPMVFLDANAGAPGVEDPTAPPGASGPVPGSAPGPAAADTLTRVSPEVLARARRRPIAGVLVLGGLVVAAVAVWFFFGRPAREGQRAMRPARATPDNLLGEDFSFENDADGWNAVENAPAAFLRSSQAQASGAFGILGDLTEGGWALHRSREVRAEPGRAFGGAAKVRVDGGAIAQVGIELDPPEGPDSVGSVVAWSSPISAAGEFASAEVEALVPPGYEIAHLLILGRGPKGSSVAADDAALSLREPSAASGSLAVEDWQLARLGEPAVAAALSRFGRTLLTGIAFAEGSSPPRMAEGGPIAAASQPGRIAIASKGRGSFRLRAESALVHAGLATIGPDGYATHGLDFERESATSLLFGKGAELVRVVFASPVGVKSVAEGQSARIEARAAPAAGGEIGEVVLQLDFTEERRKAGDLAYAARNAEKKGDLGECLRLWAELLNGFPFEEALVAEADSKRASLVQQGLSEMQAVREEVERARFFRLVDLHRQCKAKALAIGGRYRGSEVDAEARKVAAEIDLDLVELEADLVRVERGRLEAILGALQSAKAEGLAAEVRARLDKMRQPASQEDPKDPGR